jgi:hypothetical protein
VTGLACPAGRYLNDVAEGAADTPYRVVTRTAAAPGPWTGARTETLVFVFERICAVAEPNLTFVAVERFVPCNVTAVPGRPVVGDRLLTRGGATNVKRARLSNAEVLVTPRTCVRMRTYTVPATWGGVLTVTFELDSTLSCADATEPNNTFEAFENRDPVTVITAPPAVAPDADETD